MVCGGFGIHSRKRFSQGEATDSLSHKKSSMLCHLISSWMESYGMVSSQSETHHIFISFSFLFSTRFGRENFHEAMKIAQRVPEAQIDWSKFKYMVYDSPKTPDRYELRYQQLGKYTFLPHPNLQQLSSPSSHSLPHMTSGSL